MSLYESFAKAETGGEANPWIRTKSIPKEGSTAFGPVQITKGLAEDYLNNKKNLFNKEQIAYLRAYLAQAKKFNKYGNNPAHAGDTTKLKGYDSRYDYGGEGELSSDKDKELYKQVASTMLNDVYYRNLGKMDDVIKEWRFGSASKKGRPDDVRYFNIVNKAQKEASSVDSDSELENLPSATAEDVQEPSEVEPTASMPEDKAPETAPESRIQLSPNKLAIVDRIRQERALKVASVRAEGEEAERMKLSPRKQAIVDRMIAEREGTVANTAINREAGRTVEGMAGREERMQEVFDRGNEDDAIRDLF